MARDGVIADPSAPALIDDADEAPGEPFGPWAPLPAPPTPPPVDTAVVESQRRTVALVVDVVVLAACVIFTLWHLHPDLLVTDSTPAGGDMGAHVWGPAYLRDHLLPDGQVAGWTGAWYAGFPAYQFYMVVPSLLIVLLNAGIHGWAALIPATAGAACAVTAVVQRRRRWVRNLAIAGAIVGFSLVGLPYGVAFKLVSVSGVVTLPLAVYAFARMAGARFPTPAVMSVASLAFLFYRGYTIYGGNIASTLAGEFAFSMSLSVALVYLGFVFKGLETGRHRATAAALLALTGLLHLIPAFWVLGATAVVLAVRFRLVHARLPTGLPVLLGGGAGVVVGLFLRLVAGGPADSVGLGLAVLGLAAVAVGVWIVSDSARWLTPTLIVGGLLSLWWVGPFYLRRAYLNDMGWEKLPTPDETMNGWERWTQHLFPHLTPDVDLRWAFGLAVVGAAFSVVLRLRLGIFLTVVTVAAGVAFVVAPEGRLWNGRLLPFYYLTVILLAAYAVSEVVRTIGELVRAGRPAPVTAGVPTAVAALAIGVIAVGVPLGQLPYTATIENGYAWPSFSPWRVQATPASFVPSWAEWNYSGYEGKDAYREYYEIVTTMDQLGEQRGCGRAFWEYEKELDRYGSPMALMLLPHWTDGCIGSMEGLYFEAAATTPFHFLTQVELSTAPSAAQRDLPYGTFDITRGVDHLQMMGVRYYMATSDNAIAQARTHPDLTEVAASGPWVVFEVADSEVVAPLDNQPAVVEGIEHTQVDWVEQPLDESGRFGGPAVSWFTDPEQWAVPLALDGPEEWQRVAVGETPEQVPLDPVEVSDPQITDEGISFDVDQVGVPVLVKVSYFPNWRASGAEGPYRVAPNFMVVIPNDTHVELTYGRTGVEWLSYALTLLGVVGLVLLIRRPRARFAPEASTGGAEALDAGADGYEPGVDEYEPDVDEYEPDVDGDVDEPESGGVVDGYDESDDFVLERVDDDGGGGGG
jgi:hypothetical protein